MNAGCAFFRLLLAAGLVVVAHAREHIQNGYRVNTLCAVEHRVDGLKDALVFFRVKIIGAHLLDDLRNAIRIDQHRAEKRLLRGQVLRHLPH